MFHLTGQFNTQGVCVLQGIATNDCLAFKPSKLLGNCPQPPPGGRAQLVDRRLRMGALLQLCQRGRGWTLFSFSTIL